MITLTAKRNNINKKYILCYLIIFYLIYLIISRVLNRCSSTVLMTTLMLIFATKYFLPYQVWHDFDKFMHTKILKFPNYIKCFIKLNKNGKYCYNDDAMKTWESQENGDFDFYTLGHVIMWAIIGMRCDISFTQVFLFSVFWEAIESILGYYNFPCHARTTDVLINLIGFSCGRYLFRLP